jgi:hypothetical protein
MLAKRPFFKKKFFVGDLSWRVAERPDHPRGAGWSFAPPTARYDGKLCPFGKLQGNDWPVSFRRPAEETRDYGTWRLDIEAPNSRHMTHGDWSSSDWGRVGSKSALLAGHEYGG